MFRRLTMVGLATIALVSMRAPANAQGVAGTYAVEYPARISNTNGEESVQMGKARLTLHVKGDSVTGTWLSLDRPDAKPREIHGTVNGSTIRFSVQTEGRINQNGEERAVKMTTDYIAVLKGNALDGTMKSHSSEMGSSPERKWTGKRSG
jgi:hypothetical protein